MDLIKRNIPNCITCLNLAAGCMSILVSSKGLEPLWGLKAFQWGFLFIAMGALFDFFDGFAARALHAYSNLGKELDSLCDIVTFGVAPAVILFHLLNGLGAVPWLCWTVILIPVAGALRLARFNIDTRQASVFIGLPIPANAIFWVGYAALMWQGVQFLSIWYVFLCFLVVECWLMNSEIPMYSLKFKNFGIKENLPRYLLALAAGLFCFTLGVGGLFWLILFYVLLSIAYRPKTRVEG